MAARGKAMPVGSSQWVQHERDQAADFVGQDVEEFSYSVRNELDWLNERMADIFSKTEVNFTDMFKTPGKLRGKTPRTARKANALAPRQPLTDIFAPNVQPAAASPVKGTPFFEKVAQFQIPKDEENVPPQHKPAGRGTSPQQVGKPYSYTDSGYHGMMTEDEMELDAQRNESVACSSHIAAQPLKGPVRYDQQPSERNGDNHVISDDSFVSANEQKSGAENGADDQMDDAPGDTQPYTHEEETRLVANALQDVNEVQVYEDEPMEDHITEAVRPTPELEQAQVPVAQENDVDMDMDAADDQSETSSPEKPLNRKSSFTFSSLPAREPLTAKRSMGQMELNRNSVFNKSIGGRQTDHQMTDDGQEKSQESRPHGKSTAQLLHDRINMLGKTKEPRPSKSIHQMASLSHSAYPQLPTAGQEIAQRNEPFDFDFPQKTGEQTAAPIEDAEDDWIAPKKPAHPLQQKSSDNDLQPSSAKLASPRPAMHTKSISTTDIPSPLRANMGDPQHQKAISVSHPILAEILESTTPHESPSRKANDGPLSASKSRLWSALKSAKNIFASSASTSAAAKLEAYNDSQALTRSPTRDPVEQSHKVFNMPGALWSTKDVLQSPERKNSIVSHSPSRKTRLSHESEKRREKEVKAQEKAAADLEKVREKERQKAAEQQAKETAKAEKAARAEAARVEKERQLAAKAAANAPRPQSADEEMTSENEMAPPPPPKTGMLPAGKLRAPGRLMRPTKESTQSRPVAVRVPSQAQRAGQAPSSFNKSHHETLASSTSSHAGPRAGSAMGPRPGTAGGNARVKALESAARKKEADEKAAAKKAEQKRELERKRAEKAGQEKRAEEERKAAESQRIQEAKQTAERKAADKRAGEMRKREQDRAEQHKREQDRLEQQHIEQERLEQQRRDIERLRQEEDARKAREAHDLAEAIRRERNQQGQQHRGDLPGTLRQLSKNTVPSTNPAKPPKRQLEDDDHAPPPQRPGILRNGPSYQQADPKRRRTNEEQDEPPLKRTSVMAPPKRPSTMRKEPLSKFSGYAHAPPPAAHHASMFKSAVTAQHQSQHGSSKPMHPSQLVQTSSARIPFADNAKTPGQASSSQYHPGYEPHKFKTPSRPQQAAKSAKSTPQYPQGDNIELPDIATDSEDEEDEDDEPGGFRAPSWTASPALRALLTEQQLLDPEAVFGPIGELKMEEVFKNGKNQDRLKRFRDRGSSAMWVETGDAVTSAEKRRDMELRERVVREGGWRYEPGV